MRVLTTDPQWTVRRISQRDAGQQTTMYDPEKNSADHPEWWNRFQQLWHAAVDATRLSDISLGPPTYDKNEWMDCLDAIEKEMARRLGSSSQKTQ